MQDGRSRSLLGLKQHNLGMVLGSPDPALELNESWDRLGQEGLESSYLWDGTTYLGRPSRPAEAICFQMQPPDDELKHGDRVCLPKPEWELVPQERRQGPEDYHVIYWDNKGL